MWRWGLYMWPQYCNIIPRLNCLKGYLFEVCFTSITTRLTTRDHVMRHSLLHVIILWIISAFSYVIEPRAYHLWTWRSLHSLCWGHGLHKSLWLSEFHVPALCLALKVKLIIPLLAANLYLTSNDSPAFSVSRKGVICLLRKVKWKARGSAGLAPWEMKGHLHLCK